MNMQQNIYEKFEKAILTTGEFDFASSTDQLMCREFTDKKFENCVISDADFASSTFLRCKLENVIFIRCEFPGVSFDHCVLERVVFLNCYSYPVITQCDAIKLECKTVKNG